jgi:putative transposase
LFEGKFKAVHVNSNEYLLHLSAYVNLNNRAHHTEDKENQIRSRSSWAEFTSNNPLTRLCKTEIVLEQFDTNEDYKVFAENALKSIIQRKKTLAEIDNYLLE